MLLELALCILQDIIKKGATRAKSIQLVVAKTSDGDKTVVIEGGDRSDDAIGSQNRISASQIDNALFRLSDKNGNSPVVSFAIGKGKKPAYQPPDKQGYFTPSRSAKKNLQKDFEVSQSLAMA